jgi:N-acetylglucosaminyl-diphospho-decaprenol L-rhamnosyltransferase
MDSAPLAPAVVIPSWNSATLLPDCIGSIRAQGLEVELMVVDNGSTDGSVAFLEREGIDHITLPENIGFAAAVNLGVKRTAAAAILVLNADTVLEPGAVERLVAVMASDPGLGGVQPRLLQLEGADRDPAAALLYSAGQALTRDGRAVELGAGGRQSAGSLRGGEVFGVCGAACLLRRELFDDLGGYDRSFFAFYEDVDLNVRARAAGWRFEHVPEAIVWHVGNASWMAEAPQPGGWNGRLVARNRIVTQARFMPFTALPRILVVEVGALLRAARQGRLGATLRGKLEGLRRLPAALRERRRLAASGDLDRPRAWLGRS